MIFKSVPNDNYTIVPNDLIANPKISNNAKVVLIYLCSKPSNWRVSVSDIIKNNKSGRDAIYSAIKELTKLGHICRLQSKNEDGKFNDQEYIVSFDTDSLKSGYGKSVNGKTGYGKSDTNNKEYKKKDIKKKDDIGVRKNKFFELVMKTIDGGFDFPQDQVSNFVEYWTETTLSGKKMRFEKQDAFAITRRLSTWKERSSQNTFKQSSPTKPNATVVVSEIKDAIMSGHHRVKDNPNYFKNPLAEQVYKHYGHVKLGMTNDFELSQLVRSYINENIN